MPHFGANNNSVKDQISGLSEVFVKTWLESFSSTQSESLRLEFERCLGGGKGQLKTFCAFVSFLGAERYVRKPDNQSEANCWGSRLWARLG